MDRRVLSTQETVIEGLRCLGADPHETTPGVWDVALPAGVRRFFAGKKRLRLVLRYDVWQHDRSATLVTPGSRFLDQLEEALSPGPIQEVWGGELLPDASVVERWFASVRVLNARLEPTDETEAARFDRLHLILFEVDVPGPPPTTEIVPIGWDAGRDEALVPEAVAKLQAEYWYALEEVAAFIRNSDGLAEAEVLRARRRADAALGRRVGPLLHEQATQRRRGLEQARARLEADREERLAEAESTKAREEIEAEFRRRTALLDEREGAEPVVRRRLHLVLHRGRVDYRAQLAVAPGRVVAAPLPRVAGRIREDLCEWCESVRHEYLASVELESGLACTSCAAGCASVGCLSLVRRASEDPCPDCEAPRHCTDHHSECHYCTSKACVEHTQVCEADECGRTMCSSHARVTQESAVLCETHSEICEVGTEALGLPDALTCPVSGLVVCAEHGVRLEDDRRTLHPDAVVPCATTHTRVAMDRAGTCGEDGLWHRSETLQRSDFTKKELCEQHRIRVDRPAGWTVETKRRVMCPETELAIDRSVAEACSITGDLCLSEALVMCPITSRRMRPSAAAVIDGDDRLLHPVAVLRSGLSGERVARDRAVWDEVSFAKRTPLTQSEAGRCELSGKPAAESLLVGVTCCGRRVAPRFVSRSVLSGKTACDDHRALCAIHGEYVLPDESTLCEISGRVVCDSHVVTADCGRRVATDRVLGLSPGRWGCTEHYTLCETDPHPIPIGDVEVCTHCGASSCTAHLTTLCELGRACLGHFNNCVQTGCAESICAVHGKQTEQGGAVCDDHAHRCGPCDAWVSVSDTTICSCHQQQRHLVHTEADPFDSRRRYCSEAMGQCSFCGQRAPRGMSAHECIACSARQRLASRPSAVTVFNSLVLPKLDWFGLRLGTWVSFGRDRILFEVRRPSSRRRFLVDRATDSVRELRD